MGAVGEPETTFLAGGGELGAMMRGLDWAATPLGPPETWPQRLRSIVNVVLTSRFAMWMGWGPDLVFFYNDAYAPTLGVKHGRALGRASREVWEEIWDDIGPRIDSVLATGEATWDEALLLFLERSGYAEETYHTFSYSPLRDDDGLIAGHLCVVTEDTARIIGERRLRTLRDLASNLADATTEASVIDAARRSLVANDRDLPFTLLYFSDAAGQAPRLVASTGFAADTAAAWSGDTAATLWRAQEIEEGAQRAHVHLPDLTDFPSGAWQRRPRRALVLPLARQGQDQPAGFLVCGLNPHRELDGAYTDFLGLVAGQIASGLASTRAFEEERRRAEALAELDRAKTDFFSNVSHEFRTPLTLMLNPVEDLLARATGESERQLLQVAHRNAHRLLKLVNTLLDFSRIEAGRDQACYVPVDFSRVTADLAATFRSAIESAGLRLSIDAPHLPAPVFLDQDMWEKVVLNLLSNAFKFTFEGEIAVIVRADGEGVALTVRDTGTGIPAAELPNLFKRFHRVTGARGRSFEGSGIGLALVRELVERHGGSIRVESELGVGSAFIVWIPFGAAHLPPERIGAVAPQAPAASRAAAFVEEAARWLPAAPELALPAPLRHGAETGTVLLADDNADMRDYVAGLLRAAGFSVHAVADGLEAVQQAPVVCPDLVLADVMMPRLDGFGALAALRRDPLTHDIPVILLSARAGEAARVEGLQAGADDYVTKPFNARELLARVDGTLRLARLRREAAREQRRLASIVEASSDFILCTDAALNTVFVNDAGRRMVGLPESASTALPSARDFVPQGDRQRLDAEMMGALRKHGRARGEGTLRHFGGGPDIPVIYDVFRIDDPVTGRDLYFACVARDISQRRRIEARLMAQKRILEMIAKAAPLSQTLDEVALFVEAHEAGARCAVLLVSEDQTTILRPHAPSLPAAWHGYFQNIAIRPPYIGTCATALATGSVVSVSDVANDCAYSEGWRDMLLAQGFQAVRSTPVLDSEGRQVASLALYYASVRDPTPLDPALIGIASDLAAIAIERRRADDSLQELNRTLEGRVADRTSELAAANRQLLAQIDEREQMEATLRQMQRLEAVGQLTSGVAHDFNNLLTVILGQVEFARREVDSPGTLRRLGMVQEAAQRGANLTAQLLAFSRRQRLNPQPVNLNQAMRGMEELLRSTLGGTVRLEVALQPDLWPALVDQTQLELVVLNLAINARDAMPVGGALTIATANASLGFPTAPAEPREGDYVVVEVSDTGTGMSADILQRVFEPFFTTKEPGKGSGLGLAQVYGFAKQSGGGVKIDTRLGHGTSVRVYLPRAAAMPGMAEPGQAAAPSAGVSGCPHVLLVDDDPSVREVTRFMLEDLGYQVTEAGSGGAALDVLDGAGRFEVMLIDFAMPGMNGAELARRIDVRRPGVPAVLITGYADERALADIGDRPVLAKPFSAEQLAETLRQVRRRAA